MEFIRKQLDFVYIGLISILGIVFVFYVTSPFGAGLPTDGIRYLAVADSLLKGRGFFEFDQGLWIFFPPLYPLMIAGLALIARADVFLVAWYVNAFLWGINLFLSGWLLRKAFGAGSIYFYLATAMVFLSPSSLSMHTSVLTEPFFLTVSLLFILASARYLQRQTLGSFIALGFLTIGATLLRWAGLAHVAAGGLIVLWAWRRQVGRGLLWAASFGLLTSAPVAAWIYFHNYLATGTLWGSSSAGNVFVLENILQAVRKITYWFVPYRPLISSDGKIEALLLFVALWIGLLLINRRQHWQNWLRSYREPVVAAAMLLTLLNFSATTLMAHTRDHRELSSDRYYAQSLAPILVIIFLTFEHLVRPHLRFSARQVQIGLALLVLFWSALPISRLNKYAQTSLRDGEARYNLYNLRQYHTSDIIAQAGKILAQEPEARLFSNLPAPVWFFVRQPLMRLIPQHEEWTKDEFKTAMAGWPGDQSGYLIWFTDDPYRVWYPPEDLSLVADLQPVYTGADGVIYSVSARKQP